MPQPRRRRDDFEESRVYAYPQHLRAAIEDAPTGADVYVFHGEAGDLPLYIGKSVNIRARLLSHLRNADEARMLRQTQRISHICTAGEIGTLLLEAQMIKQLPPLFNQKLRRNRQLCSLQLQGGRPEVVYFKDIDFATAPELYGLLALRVECWPFAGAINQIPKMLGLVAAIALAHAAQALVRGGIVAGQRRDRFAQRRVGLVEVDIDERRRLVEDLVGVGHGGLLSAGPQNTVLSAVASIRAAAPSGAARPRAARSHCGAHARPQSPAAVAGSRR